jgi:hypothetical protein
LRSRRLSLLAGLLGLAISEASPARAAEAARAPAPPITKPAKPKEPSSGRRALGVGASVVPGVLVHGTGHYVLGEPRTGTRLLLAEGIGLGAIAVGGVGLFASGASRYLVAPAAALTIAGAGIFAVSWLADVYGSAAAEPSGSPRLRAPVLESELGYRYVYDPQFRYRSFLVEALDLRWQNVRIAPSGWFALDDVNRRLRLLGAWRFFGPMPARAAPAKDGSFLDLELAVTDHRYDSDGFAILTWEVGANGRFDLDRYDEALRGSFAELGLGYALEAYDYDVPGLELGRDLEHLLLMRFGFGIYLGSKGSEAMLYYDHRHDGFAAGLKLTGLASGIPGHFGVASRLYFDDSFGLLLDAQIGSAYVLGLSALYRHAGAP